MRRVTHATSVASVCSARTAGGGVRLGLVTAAGLASARLDSARTRVAAARPASASFPAVCLSWPSDSAIGVQAASPSLGPARQGYARPTGHVYTETLMISEHHYKPNPVLGRAQPFWWAACCGASSTAVSMGFIVLLATVTRSALLFGPQVGLARGPCGDCDEREVCDECEDCDECQEREECD